MRFLYTEEILDKRTIYIYLKQETKENIMRRIASLFLVIVLILGLSPSNIALASPSDESSPHEVYDLEDGTYVEGRVLLLVDESAPMALSGSSTSKDLFAFSQPIVKTTSGEFELESDNETFSRGDNGVMALSVDGDTSASESDSYASGSDEMAVDNAHIVMVEDESKTTADLLDEYAEAPGVLLASPDYLYETTSLSDSYNDPLIDEQWFLDDDSAEGSAAGIDAQAAWNRNINGGVSSSGSSDQPVVAVIDTGVDYTHPDLAASMWTGGEQIAESLGLSTEGEVQYGYDTFAATDDYPDEDGYGPMDHDSHGTHVAGIIAAQLNNDEGGSGVAPGAKIMALRAGNGAFSSSAIFLAYNYIQTACNAGVNVVTINNSWGGYYSSSIYGLVADALYEKGALSIKAAGNSSVDHDGTNTDDSASKTNIVVNASTKEGTLADFSDYGAASTDIVAPGENILSTVPEFAGSADLSNNDNVVFNGSTAYIDRFDGDSNGLGFKASVQSNGLDEPATLSEEDGSLTWNMHLSPVGSSSSLELSQEAGPIPREVSEKACGIAFQVESSCPQTTDGFSLQLTAKGLDGNWIDLGTLGVMSGNNLALVTSVSQENKEKIDWDNFALCFKRSATENTDGFDLTIKIKAIALISSVDPYGFMSGTSMATPVVSGAVALLSQAYPDESVGKISARIIGGAEHIDTLEGLSRSDGRLDLNKALNDPNPVVTDFSQDEADPSKAQVTGFFFGNNPVVDIDGMSAQVNNVTDNEDGSQTLSVTLPDSLSEGEQYVKVVSDSGKGNWGRLLTTISPVNGVESAYFEELSFPDDPTQLEGCPEGMTVEKIDDIAMPSQITSLEGKLYVTTLQYQLYSSEENKGYPCIFVYDLQTGTWRIDDKTSSAMELSNSTISIAADGSCLYGLTADAFWTYDPSKGTVEKTDLQSSLFDVFGIPQDSVIYWLSAKAYDGELLVSGASYGGGAVQRDATSSETAVVNIESGSVEKGATLQEAGISTTLMRAGDVLIASPGASLDSNSIPSKSTGLQLYDPKTGSWNRASALPFDIEVNQDKFALCAPANNKVIVSGLRASTANSAGIVPDTYLYDTKTDTWSESKVQLSPYKLIAPAGIVANDGYLYVVAFDTLHNGGNLVLKRAKIDDILGSSDGEENAPGGNSDKDPEHGGNNETESPDDQKQDGQMDNKEGLKQELDNEDGSANATQVPNTSDPLSGIYVPVAAGAVLAAAMIVAALYARRVRN